MMTFSTIIWILIIAGAIFWMIKRGGGGCCGGHDHGTGGHSGHDHNAMLHGKTEGAKEVEAGKDPVCGMGVGSSDIFSSYAGKKYSFCSDNCRKTFDADPGKFVA